MSKNPKRSTNYHFQLIIDILHNLESSLLHYVRDCHYHPKSNDADKMVEIAELIKALRATAQEAQTITAHHQKNALDQGGN